MMANWDNDEGGDNATKSFINDTALFLFSSVPTSVTSDYVGGEASTENDYYDNNLTLSGVTPTPTSFQNNSTNTSINPRYEYESHDDNLYQVPGSIVILLSLFYGGISVAALIGNLLVLWVVAVSRRMRTVTNMFIANLALADIIIGLFTIPFQFQAALLQRWNLPDFMCAFCPFVQVLSVNISVFTLSAIAVDRYRAVLYPLSARASKRKATWAILSIWSVGLILALPTELDYKVIEVPEKGSVKPFCTNLGLSETFRLYYSLGLVVIQYFFPLIIITGAYAHMATKLWGATAPGNKEESRDAVVLRNKKKVIKMLALVVLLFAVCWMPLQMYNFLQPLIPSINEYHYINIIWFSMHWLAMSNSCCNPFIYAIYNDKFQREFRARLWCLRACGRHGSDEMYSEASDFDRSKIRASYRFTNNRSVRYSQNVYGRTSVDIRRQSSCTSRRYRCERSSVSGNIIDRQLHHLHPDYDHNTQNPNGGNSRYLGVTGYGCGAESTVSNMSTGTTFIETEGRLLRADASPMLAELEGASLRNADLENGRPHLNGGIHTGSAETSLELSPTGNFPPVAVITSAYRPSTNNNGKTVTIVATDSTFKL